MNATTYTDKQHQVILQGIAQNTMALNRLLMLVQETDGEEREWILYAAQKLAEHIGGMADGASGGQIYGNADSWSFGPRFIAAAQEGSAA